MDFNWAGLIYWVLVAIGLVSFVWGLWKKFWKAYLVSGITIFLPALYFVGGEGWIRLIGLTPLIPFALAYITKKERN